MKTNTSRIGYGRTGVCVREISGLSTHTPKAGAFVLVKKVMNYTNGWREQGIQIMERTKKYNTLGGDTSNSR